MKRYTVEYNGKRYVLEGDREPTESDMANLVNSQEQPNISQTRQPNISDMSQTRSKLEPIKQYGIGLTEGAIDTIPTPETALKVGVQVNPLLKPLQYGMEQVPLFKGKPATKFVEESREQLREFEKPKSLGLQTARALGYITPMFIGGKKVKGDIAKSPENIYKKSKGFVRKATEEFRTLLRPTQGEIRNLEIRGSKNINKYYKLAAEEGIPIKTGADNKLNTLEAIEVIRSRQKPLHDAMQKILAKKSNKQIPFDLYKIGKQAKKELQSTFKNAKEYEQVSKYVDEYIQSEINKYGSRYLTGEQLNNVKQGLWSVGYDVLKPSSDKVARKMGHIAKELIEKSYKTTKVKELNKLSGDLATLSQLLKNAHGRVIQGGKIGRYAARGIGAMSMDRIPVVGPLIGAKIGDKVSRIITSPERMSKSASKLIGKSKAYNNILINQMNKNKNITKTSEAVSWLTSKLSIDKQTALQFIKDNYGKLRK